MNYACWKGCIRENKATAKRKMEEAIAEAEMMAALLGLWRPKEGDKCDYKPKELGESSYFMVATVGDVTTLPKGKLKLSINFFIDGAPKTETSDFPNPNV